MFKLPSFNIKIDYIIIHLNIYIFNGKNVKMSKNAKNQNIKSKYNS